MASSLTPTAQSDLVCPAGDLAALQKPVDIEPQRSYIQELPPELLCHIFAAIDDYADLVTSTHVCTHWRAVSLASPARLWSTVRSLNGVAGVFTQTMARTQQVPTRVAVGVCESNADEVARVLSEHLLHIQTLCVHFYAGLDDWQAAPIARALSGSAPLLQKLVILDEYNVISDGFHVMRLAGSQDHLFGGQAPPGLTCFKLYGSAHAYSAAPALSNVRQVLFQPAALNTFRPADLNAAMRFGPFEHLEMLALWVTPWISPPDFTAHLPPRLKALCLRLADQWYSPADFMSSLSGHQAVPHIRVAYVNPCAQEIALGVLDYVLPSAGPVVELEIDMSMSGLMMSQARTSTGSLREVVDTRAVLSTAVFDTLTRLSVGESEWTFIDTFPLAPLLTHLTVYLVAPAYMETASASRSVFVDLDSGGVLCAPRLQVFCVSSRHPGDPTLLGTTPTLAPDAVTQFLGNRVSYDRAKLSALVLNGVRLLENLVDEVIDLLELVDDVQCGPGHGNPTTALDELVVWR